MAQIAIYADALAVYTSSTPSREMLLKLMQIRAQDHFIFVLFRGSHETKWWKEYRSRFQKDTSWSEFVLPITRRANNLRTLLGKRYLPSMQLRADVFIRLDVGTMGRSSTPLVQQVADLSSIKIPRSSTQKWHGRALFRRYLRDGAKLANKTVCISKHTASDVAAFYPQLANTISVIPNGLSEAWFRHDHGNSAPGSHRGKRPYFIWYGHISSRKNLTRLVEAYQLFARNNSNPDLMIVSDNGQTLLPLIEKLNLENRVSVIKPKPLNELVELVIRSHGVVFPSLYEGFGMPIVEAFATGVPVLTSRLSAMPEVAGGLALLCDPEDVTSIASGLGALANSEQRSDERMRARRAHAAKFTADASAQLYSDLIDDVLRA